MELVRLCKGVRRTDELTILPAGKGPRLLGGPRQPSVPIGIEGAEKRTGLSGGKEASTWRLLVRWVGSSPEDGRYLSSGPYGMDVRWVTRRRT